jgi:hypothetical protein
LKNKKKKNIILTNYYWTGDWFYIFIFVIVILCLCIYTYNYNYIFFIKEICLNYTLRDIARQLPLGDLVKTIPYSSELKHEKLLRKIIYLPEHIGSYKFFWLTQANSWPLKMIDIYFWCFDPFFKLVDIVKVLYINEQDFMILCEETYKTRGKILAQESIFYRTICASKASYYPEEFFTFSLHHYWLIEQTDNIFYKIIPVHTRDYDGTSFSYNHYRAICFSYDYIHYHIAYAQAKIDTIKFYNIDLNLLPKYENDLKIFLNLKKDLKLHLFGNTFTSVNELPYISKRKFSETNWINTFYNPTFKKFLIKYF